MIKALPKDIPFSYNTRARLGYKYIKLFTTPFTAEEEIKNITSICK